MRKQRLYFGNRRKPVTRAILHCAAVPSDWAANKTLTEMIEIITGWHKKRGFVDIGYHYVVSPEGYIGHGRQLHRMGAHTLGQNEDTLGILMVESNTIRKMGQFSDYFTDRQRLAVGEIMRYHEIKEIHGHNEYDPMKLCPGFKVQELPSGFFDRSPTETFLKRLTSGLSEKRDI